MTTQYRTLSWLDAVALLDAAQIKWVEVSVSTTDKSVSAIVRPPDFNRNGQLIQNKAGWLLTRLKAHGATMTCWSEVDKRVTFLVPERVEQP